MGPTTLDLNPSLKYIFVIWLPAFIEFEDPRVYMSVFLFVLFLNSIVLIFQFNLIFVAFIIVQQFLSLTNCPTPIEPEWKCFKLAKVSYILVVPFSLELFSLSCSTYVHYLK